MHACNDITIIVCYCNNSYNCRGAMIKRKLRKVDPYRPIEFARKAQEQFVRTNEAIQK